MVLYMQQRKKDIYDYYELIDNAKTKKEREALIEEALLSEPENLQLLLMKNDKNKKNLSEYLAGLERIVALGNKQMQAEGYFKNDKGDFWLVYETRPYMGACYEYFTALMRYGFITKAIKEGERLLELNENDNLGIRYDLMHLFALSENREKAEKLLNAHGDHSSQMVLPLCFLYYKIGEEQSAAKLLSDLQSKNKDLLKFVKKVLNDSIFIEISKIHDFGYRPGTIEELADGYGRYHFIYDTCPVFFDWAKSTLEAQKKL